MKITCGLGSIDDYVPFAKAGADECFFGYVPEQWMERFGEAAPLNRREVLFYNVQIGSFSELCILQDMVEAIGVPVTMTLNAIHMDEVQRHQALDVVAEAMTAGVRSLIVADTKLLAMLSEQYGGKKVAAANSQDAAPISLHLSGECGELNHLVIEAVKTPGLKRIIFPRQTSPEEMASMIRRHPDYEYEAFVLNEKCHFTGAYCNSVHCDALCHACRIPYRLSGPGIAAETGHADCSDESVYDGPGAAGCGLCQLWAYRAMGITHLKLVSRGNDTESTIEDIVLLKQALQILDASDSEKEFHMKVKEQLFSEGCSENCYGGLYSL